MNKSKVIFDILMEFARGNFKVDYKDNQEDEYLSAILQGLKMVGEEMEDRLNRLSMANAELEKLNQQLKEFNYITVHDLRSPLASQMGLINLLRSDPKNTGEYLNLMERTVSKLDNTITDLLTFSKTRIKELNIQPIDIERTIDEILISISSMENFKEIRFEKEISYKQPFYSDSFLFQTILKNLITNAVKYHRKNIDNAFVLIKIEEFGKGLSILIKDNGQGIPKEIQNKIFHKIVKGCSDIQGTGLGLYITHGAIEKLKGTISFESKGNKGTSFNIYLPDRLVLKEL